MSDTNETTETEAEGETALGGATEAQPVAEDVEAEADVAVEAETPEAEAEETPAELPEKYELKASDEAGEIDQEVAAAADPVFREIGLNQEQAQSLVPLAEKIVSRTEDALAARGAEMKQGWLEAAKAAEDIGGDKWDETISLGAKALDALGFSEGHDFRTVLNETGFGNHPDMLRMARTLGALVAEDGKFPTGGGGGKEPDVLTRLYPDDVPKN